MSHIAFDDGCINPVIKVGIIIVPLKVRLLNLEETVIIQNDTDN